MSRDRVSPELVERWAARVARAGAEVAGRIDVYAIAAAVSDEARHGKDGTVRSPNGVFTYRVSQCLRELADRRRSGHLRTAREQRRYARLWVQLLRLASEEHPRPGQLAALLRAVCSHGFPQLNPLIAEELTALGDCWDAPAAGSVAGEAHQGSARPPQAAQAAGQRPGAVACPGTGSPAPDASMDASEAHAAGGGR